MATATSASAPERVLLRLEWSVIRRLDGLLQGDYRSLFFGAGVDFATLREYQVTDDVRYIDWNVTARMDTPFVRVYQEDRQIDCWFLLDLSPSLDFGTVQTERDKRQVVIDLATTLARILTRRGNRVGALLYGAQVDVTMPPRSGRDQVLRLTDALLHAPHLHRVPSTDLGVLLTAGLRSIKRRSMVVIVSDFISVPGWERPLGLLGRRNEVLAVRVRDPRETTLPNAGILVMEDAETGEQLTIDTHDRGFRERFAEAALRRERDLSAAFDHAGVDAMPLSTDDDLVRAIVRMAARRRRRRRL